MRKNLKKTKRKLNIKLKPVICEKKKKKKW